MVKSKKTFVATVHGGTCHPKIVGKGRVGKQAVTIAEVDQKIKGGYVGLNKEAAKQLGIPTNIPYGEVIIYKGSPKTAKEHTIRHELIEEHAVRYGHLSRKTSHLLALTFERTDLPPAQALKLYKTHKK